MPWREKWQPTLTFLPEKTPWTEEASSLANYSPWGHKGLDISEHIHILPMKHLNFRDNKDVHKDSKLKIKNQRKAYIF